MKRKKQKAILKESKKAAKKMLKTTIIDALTTLTVNFGPVSKKAAKVIEKSAAQIAKKLAKEITYPAVETAEPVVAE